MAAPQLSKYPIALVIVKGGIARIVSNVNNSLWIYGFYEIFFWQQELPVVAVVADPRNTNSTFRNRYLGSSSGRILFTTYPPESDLLLMTLPETMDRPGLYNHPSTRPSGYSQLLTCGPEQYLIHIHFLRLAHGEGNCPCERFGGKCYLLNELADVLGDIRLGNAIGQFRGQRTR
jgi:hypothetical protein